MTTRNRSNRIAAADDAVELEALRKEDNSWHPCQVYQSSNRVGLIVHYGNSDSEDIMVYEEEAIARLRIRSIPLDGDDCIHIQEGEHVLATEKSQSKSLFFDAGVEKALTVRHSKKVHCRCMFVIKWLHQELKGGTFTVPSSSVMKLANKSINEHPTVSAFLSRLKSLGCSGTSPLPAIIEDMDWEIDLHELLEKQREIISNLVDGSMKRVSDNNILLCVEVDNKGRNKRRRIAGSKLNKSDFQVPPDHSHLRRTTRSTNKLQKEVEVKDPSSHAPSLQEELSKSRFPLKPLAACAALAPLLSKMPQILGASINNEDKLDYTHPSDNIACKLDVMRSLNGTKSSNTPSGNNFSVTDKLSLQTASTSVPFAPDTNKDVNSLISTSASGKTQLMPMNASSVTLSKERETGNITSEIPDSSSSFTFAVAKRKLSQPPKVTKLTRSAIEKGAGIRDETTERKTCVEQKKLQSSTNPRRFTCSAVRDSIETEIMEAKQELPPIEESHNGGKMSSAVKTCKKSEGNGESSTSLKRKSTSSKKELRYSPRLRFLPRTRSQNKSWPGNEGLKTW